MASGTELTPLDDQVTQLLPLPIFMQGPDFGLSREDFHHHFHPEKSPQLGFNCETGRKYDRDDEQHIAGRAVRFCRGQKVPRWLHERYNDIFSGPPLPDTPKDRFTTVVLACAGVVPRRAIKLYKAGEYTVVDLNDRQHEFIRKRISFEDANNPLKTRRPNLGHFLADYVIANSVSEVVTEKLVRQRVSEFLRPKSEEQRLEAGRFILAAAIDASVADLLPIHQEARQSRLVSHPRRSLGDVVLRFFPQDRFEDYYGSLQDQIELAVA